jgi:hypothetical protein
MPRARRTVPLFLTTVLTVAGGQVVTGAPLQASPRPQVRLTFDNAAPGTDNTSLLNSGTVATTITVVTGGGGKLGSVLGARNSGRAARFPRFSGDADGPKVGVAVQDLDGPHGLNPLSARLEFGADVVLDRGATTMEGSGDDGNNILQRGLGYQPAQFKLEFDTDRPTCSVRGSLGTITARSPVPVAAGVRLRLRCVRPAGANRVTLTVTRLNANGTPVTWRSTTSSKGTIGSVDFTSAPAMPLSVGSKLDDRLAVVQTDTNDQFNGVIDNVVLQIG